MNDYLANTFYAQPDYHIYLACSQCLKHNTCLHLECMGLTRDELREVGLYRG